MDRSGPPPGHVRVARIGRSHGLAGAMHVRLEADASDTALSVATTVWIDDLGEAEIVHFGPHGRGHLLELDRVRRVETAKRLVHAGVYLPSEVLDAALREDDAAADVLEETSGPDPKRWIGRPVRHDGDEVGTVEDVLGSPLQPLLSVAGPAGRLLLPAHAPYVRADEDAIELIDPPAGLLDPA